jgi:hypothetical protein
MASTYSDLKFELIGTGEQSGTWGTTTNTNLGTAIQEAITGSADVTFASGTVTLTLTNTNATQTARNLRLNLTGTSGGAQNLIVPTIEKFYLVNNGVADAITVKNSTGTGIAVPTGKAMLLFNDGTNVVEAITYATNLAASGANSDITSLSGLTTALSIAQGGTGATTADTALDNLGGTTVGKGVFKAATAAAAQQAMDTEVGVDVQAYDADLTALGGLAKTDGNIIVGAGTTWIAESGATARTSLGVGTGSNVQFNSIGAGTAASGTTGEIRATNDVVAYYSDDRLKIKKGNIENALGKVMTLNGFHYTANELAESLGYEVKPEIGVSAQEVQKILPEIVVPAPIDEKYLTVHYHKLVPLLIESIKELNQKLDMYQKHSRRKQ